MNETYIPGFSNTLRSGSLRRFAVGGRAGRRFREEPDFEVYGADQYYQPTPQPVQAAPYYAPEPVQATPAIDLGDWSYNDAVGLQNLFFPKGVPPVNGTPEEQAAWQAENARTPDQFWADLRASKAAEMASTNPYSNSGLDAINYNIWNSFMPQETGEIFRFDTGNDIGVPDGQGGWTYRNAGQVMFLPGETYQMTDKSGQVIGTASTPEEMAQLVAKSENTPFYNLERTVSANPGVDLGGMMPSKTDAGSLGSMLVNMAALALPAVGGAALGPVLAGGLGTGAAVGTGLGTALGTAAAGAAAGKSIEDILLQSALAGLTAGGLASLGGAKPNIGDLQTQVIDGTMSLAQATNALKEAGATASQIAQFASDVGSVASSAFPTVIGNVAGGAVGSGVGSAIAGAGLGALSGANTTSGQQPTAPQPTFDEAFGPGWDVLANKVNLPANVVAGGAGVGAGAINSGLDANGVPEGVGETQEVIGAKKPELPSIPAPPMTTPPSQTLPDNEIVVTANKPTTKLPDSVNAILATIPSLATNLPQTPGATTDAKKGLTTKDYLQLAGIGLGLVGDLTKGGSGGKIPGGLGGGLSPIFSSQLPTSKLPPATTRPASTLPQSTQDWYRYGYGPEQSFFSNVPQGAPNTSTAYTGYAEGGSTGTGHGSRSSFAVGGPGDGRDDKIPAMLSDGEYVMDAETVAMLGNGSSKAGADALDKFRVAVRKHKGRDLAKGKFSANAKKPDQYLKGRK